MIELAPFERGVAFLSQVGLNLLAVLDYAGLPVDVRATIEANPLEPGDFRRLVLLGHGGRRLWHAIEDHGREAVDPVDRFSLAMAGRFVDHYLGGADVQIIYPGPYQVPLGRLGELAGWSHPSPLGLGINEQYGLWWAFRVAFLTAAELPLRRASPSAWPCAACQTKPCLEACPAGAVRKDTGFDVSRCSGHRLQPGSRCADRCLARLACPVAPEHRYSTDQLRYHYLVSLDSVRRYSAGATEGNEADLL